jgi:hypothetical protein
MAAAALTATLVACGDDAPSRAGFIAKADAACAPGNNAISTMAKPTNAPQVATAAGTATTTVDGQVAALRNMKLPGGRDKGETQGIINALAGVSAPTKALQDAAGKSDDAAMTKAALDMQAQADTAANFAQTYGLTQCGTLLKPGLGNMFDGVKNVVKANYVPKAEDLCRAFYRKSDSLPAPGSTITSFGRFIDSFTTLSTQLLTDLRALPAPPGDEATVGEFLAALDSTIAKLKDAAAAAKAGNARLAGALFDEVDVAETALNAKFDAYGLKICGSSGG